MSNKRNLPTFNLAATQIQKNMRGKFIRSRFNIYKSWKGINAFDQIMYQDEDIYKYLIHTLYSTIGHPLDSHSDRVPPTAGPPAQRQVPRKVQEEALQSRWREGLAKTTQKLTYT